MEQKENLTEALKRATTQNIHEETLKMLKIDIDTPDNITIEEECCGKVYHSINGYSVYVSKYTDEMIIKCMLGVKTDLLKVVN